MGCNVKLVYKCEPWLTDWQKRWANTHKPEKLSGVAWHMSNGYLCLAEYFEYGQKLKNKDSAEYFAQMQTYLFV